MQFNGSFINRAFAMALTNHESNFGPVNQLCEFVNSFHNNLGPNCYFH